MGVRTSEEEACVAVAGWLSEGEPGKERKGRKEGGVLGGGRGVHDHIRA